jgi:hypothetical protein
VLVAKRVPERQRHAVMAAAEEKLAKQIAAGQTHRVKVYDKAAPPQRHVHGRRRAAADTRAGASALTSPENTRHARIPVRRPTADGR